MKLPEFLHLEEKAEPISWEQVADTGSAWNPVVNGLVYWSCPRAGIRATELANGNLLLKFENHGLFARVAPEHLKCIDFAAVLREFGFERIEA
jgi:hypothetical protein